MKGRIFAGEKIPPLTPINGISAFRSFFSCKKNKKKICKALKSAPTWSR